MFRHSATSPLDVDAVWTQLQKPDKWKAMGGIDEIHDPRIEEDLLKGFAFTSRIAGTAYRGAPPLPRPCTSERMVVDVDTSELKALLTVELTPDRRLDSARRHDATLIEELPRLDDVGADRLDCRIGAPRTDRRDDRRLRLNSGLRATDPQ